MIRKSLLSLWIAAAVFSFSCPAWASSKSVTIRVSCTVLPVLQVSSVRGAETNLKTNYSSVTTMENRGGVLTKVLSVTAL